jgi:hypothetical protein
MTSQVSISVKTSRKTNSLRKRVVLHESFVVYNTNKCDAFYEGMI